MQHRAETMCVNGMWYLDFKKKNEAAFLKANPIEFYHLANRCARSLGFVTQVM